MFSDRRGACRIMHTGDVLLGRPQAHAVTVCLSNELLSKSASWVRIRCFVVIHMHHTSTAADRVMLSLTEAHSVPKRVSMPSDQIRWDIDETCLWCILSDRQYNTMHYTESKQHLCFSSSYLTEFPSNSLVKEQQWDLPRRVIWPLCCTNGTLSL